MRVCVMCLYLCTVIMVALRDAAHLSMPPLTLARRARTRRKQSDEGSCKVSVCVSRLYLCAITVVACTTRRTY